MIGSLVSLCGIVVAKSFLLILQIVNITVTVLLALVCKSTIILACASEPCPSTENDASAW